MELLNHLKHPHPLVLSEEYCDHSVGEEYEVEEYYDHLVEKHNCCYSCSVCSDSVSGLCYCCQECKFVVHKWCAELPLELTNHQLHPDHPLVILSYEERDKKEVVCKDCEEVIGRSYAFGCKECLFLLHPECALLPKPLVLEYNDADSLPARKPLEVNMFSFRDKTLCRVCNQKIDTVGLVNVRGICRYYHIQCGTLPKTVKHEKHIHDLTLHVRIEKEKNYYIGCYCDLCEEERDPDQWLYYCERCEVKGHLSCGLLGNPPPNKRILTSSPLYVVERKTAPSFVNKDYILELATRILERPEDTRPLGELIHFNHEHPLFLYDEVWSMEHKCIACNMSLHGMVCACNECNFFLHKWCAELPQEVYFGFHFEHPLTLSSTHQLACSYCRTGNDSFSYCCLECSFSVHTTCAFLYELGPHKSHDHPLEPIIFVFGKHSLAWSGKISIKSLQTPPCNACLFPCEGMSLGCKQCSFYLHVNCYLYPTTRKAETHRHSLNLTYAYQEDPVYTDFYCNACETPRNPKCWVYSCPDPKCDIVAHLDCGEPILFPTSSSDQMTEHQEDCNDCRCATCDKERDPGDWVYYCPSPSLHLLHGLERPNSDQAIQRVLKSDPVYTFLKDRVSRNISKVEELQHFSHEHLLVLCDKKWNSEIFCEACRRGIYGKTYMCHECGYYLHKWCAQIPQEMHFKCHFEHPLTLLPEHQFDCSVCEASSFGFSFSCEKCDFEVDPLCVLKPDRNLESHEHPVDIMVYMPENSNRGNTGIYTVQKGGMPLCNACQFPCEGMTIECKQCEFHLHVGCSWYPRSSKTEAHKHSLIRDDTSILPYDIIPMSKRWLCDVCDKQLTKDAWGYICLDEKCNLTAVHLHCAVPNLFLTSSFESILVHPEE